MEVKIQLATPITKQCRDVSVGEIFIFAGQSYISVEAVDSYDIMRCMNLSSGSTKAMRGCETVTMAKSIQVNIF